jgi:hypothetical protein
MPVLVPLPASQTPLPMLHFRHVQCPISLDSLYTSDGQHQHLPLKGRTAKQTHVLPVCGSCNERKVPADSFKGRDGTQ